MVPGHPAAVISAGFRCVSLYFSASASASASASTQRKFTVTGFAPGSPSYCTVTFWPALGGLKGEKEPRLTT